MLSWCSLGELRSNGLLLCTSSAYISRICLFRRRAARVSELDEDASGVEIMPSTVPNSNQSYTDMIEAKKS